MDEINNLIILAQNGNKKAREKLISDNIGLIWSIVKKFSNRGYELEDLFQIGAIGLLKCIDKFDNNFKVKFSTYAVPMIIGEIKRFLRDDGLIKISRPIKEIGNKIKYIQENFFKKNGYQPTLKDLEHELNIPREDLIIALDANKNIESIYNKISQSDGSTCFLLDKLKFDDQENLRTVNKIAIHSVMKNKLNDLERKLIEQRYFLDKTQSEVAKNLNLSQVQVSRFEKKILNKLRQNM